MISSRPTRPLPSRNGWIDNVVHISGSTMARILKIGDVALEEHRRPPFVECGSHGVSKRRQCETRIGLRCGGEAANTDMRRRKTSSKAVAAWSPLPGPFQRNSQPTNKSPVNRVRLNLIARFLRFGRLEWNYNGRAS